MTPQIKQRIEKIRHGEVPKGYIKIKDGIYPADWSIKRIKQWISLKERPIVLQDDIDYELVTVRRAYGGVNSRGSYKGKEVLVKAYFSVKEDDFIISKRQIAHGACGLVPTKLHGSVVSNEYNVFKANEGTNIHFFNLMMQLPHYKRLFYLMSDGVHIEKLLFKTSDWMKRSLAMPPLDEQTKIAEILSTQDKLITLKEKLINEKKRQKKYLMQQLLTSKKRLPGFSGKWKLMSLGEITKMNSGGTPDSQNANYYGNDYIWISIRDMSSVGKYISSSANGLSKLGYENSSAKLFPKGTVLFAMYASIGECSIASVPCCTSQAILGINPSSLLLNEFLYYYLLNGKETFKNLGQASSQPNLNKKIVQSFEINLPEQDEQLAIVNILSKADEEISLLELDINQEKQKKKALMQLLLTGIARV